MFVCVRECVCIYVCVYICVCMSVFKCACVQLDRNTGCV